jgi:hypothetical protein
MFDEENYLIEEMLMEMANIDPREHNFGVSVKINILQPGQKKIPHGPRVKIFRGSQEYTITLDKDEDKVKEIGEVFLNRREAKIIFDNIVKHRNHFLSFWSDPQMTVAELMDKINQSA